MKLVFTLHYKEVSHFLSESTFFVVMKVVLLFITLG